MVAYALDAQYRADLARAEVDHVETYAGFRHMVRWFAAHVLIDLIGIACFVTGNVFAGALFVVAGTALLIRGILTTKRAAREHHREMERG